MYRNGLRTKVVLKKRALRKVVEAKRKHIKSLFSHGI